MTNKRLKAKALPIPKNRDEADQFLHDIGDLQRQVTRIKTAMDDQIIEIKRGFEDEALPINQEIDEKFAALHSWAENNRETLLKGKGKSLHLGSGALGWRKNPPKVSLSKVAEVIKAIKQLGHTHFLRTKEEVNKDAMLVDVESQALADSIKGVKIVQSEDFFAKPFETQMERVETVKKAA